MTIAKAGILTSLNARCRWGVGVGWAGRPGGREGADRQPCAPAAPLVLQAGTYRLRATPCPPPSHSSDCSLLPLQRGGCRQPHLRPLRPHHLHHPQHRPAGCVPQLLQLQLSMTPLVAAHCCCCRLLLPPPRCLLLHDRPALALCCVRTLSPRCSLLHAPPSPARRLAAVPFRPPVCGARQQRRCTRS